MTNWRSIGDTTIEAYELEFARLNSPMLPVVEDVYTAAIPHSALALAMMWVEQKYGTYTKVISADHHNPLSLRGEWPNWRRFATYADGVRAWRERITDPNGPYRATVTVEDLVHVYAPGHDNNDEAQYAADIHNITVNITEEAPVADRPKILLTRGHGTTGDTGAIVNVGGVMQAEETYNKRIVPAIARELREHGWDVTTYPADPTQEVAGTLDTEGAYARDWMASLRGAPGVMIDCHLESSPASGIFAIVPNLGGLVTGAAARQDARDQWGNNVGDRALGRAICECIAQESGIGIRESWVREKGLMSEDMTWVGQGGGGAYAPSRLAMFGYTSPYCTNVYRLVVEFANLQHNSAHYTNPNFPAQCGRGVLRALEKVFGVATVVEPEVEVIQEKVVHALHGALVRQCPDTSSPVKIQYKKRTALRLIARATRGQTVGGSNQWWQIKSKGPSNKGFIHQSGLERVETN